MRQSVDLARLASAPSDPPTVVPLGHPVWQGVPLDTDAFQSAWSERGVDLLAEVEGHHGLGVVDPQRGEVTLGRGPHGSDPIYYRVDGSTVVWGDRMAEVADGCGRRSFDPTALADMLNYRWCLGRNALIAGVRQTRSGEAVTIPARGTESSRRIHDIRFAPEVGPEELDVWADRIEAALMASLRTGIGDAERPAVLLSGGTDSSILAALALRIRPDLVALTPTWSGHPDPELERARLYAERLGIEHRVVVIRDEEVPRAVSGIARAMEQPPRTNWAFALERCLAGASDRFDVVVHGMAADTLFGSGQVVFAREYTRKWRLARWLPARRLVAATLRGKGSRSRRMRVLLTRSPDEAFLLSNRTTATTSLSAARPDLFGNGFPDPTFLDVAWDRGGHPLEERAQRFNLFGAGQAQMLQLSRAGAAHGARFVVPFVEPPALDVGLALPRSLRLVDGHTKPVLRRLSERLFDVEWAGRPKLAFPMPNRAWQRGCLAPWFETRLGPASWARESFGDAVDQVDPDRDEDLVWTLAFLDEVAKAFGVEPGREGP